jgi:glucosyl-3-phosphoglycerate synthase
MRRFHHLQFPDSRSLAELKGDRKVSVCIPTLNEAATIGRIVSAIHESHVTGSGLVDEILVIDSGSSDGTLQAATAAGARALLASSILPSAGNHRGKGENLWKALHAASGDLICYIDGDLEDFQPYFINGLLGPLITRRDVDYVKAYYERPLSFGDGGHPATGARVSEILVRPLLSLFYPELSGILQPLAGEYAARRETLESLTFPTGYGVEIAHLIDLHASGRAGRIAQTDLVRRTHRNRSEQELGAMAFAILKVVMRRLARDGRLRPGTPLPDLYRSWGFESGEVSEFTQLIPEPERPALRTEPRLIAAP